MVSLVGAFSLCAAASPTQTAPVCRADRDVYVAGARIEVSCAAQRYQRGELLAPGKDEAAATIARNAPTRFASTLPRTLRRGAYLLRMIADNGTPISAGFVRIAAPGELTVFNVKRETWRGLPILRVDGGMSAEYAVAKAAAHLASGIAASWEVSAPGSGPRPVFSTPDFLSRSLKAGVDLYDSMLGPNAAIDNVILATGVPSAPYVARALDAPILPAHFLIDVASVAEVEDVLDRAAQQGLSAYATVSHDPSVEGAVAWIKLSRLPPIYRDFLARHHVKRVYIFGSSNTTGGETAARRVLRGEGVAYAPGSVYVMYPGSAPDEQRLLRERLADLEHTSLGEIEHVVDWESGIAPSVASAFAADSCRIPVASAVSMSSNDLLDLYDLATWASAAYTARNRALYPKAAVHGIAMNPYLTAQPDVEARKGFLPVVFWQGNPPERNAERAERLVRAAASVYLPDASPDRFEVQLNYSHNFGYDKQDALAQAFVRRGYTAVNKSDIGVDDVWNLRDGINSLSERAASDLLGDFSASEYAHWIREHVSLSVEDFRRIALSLPGLTVREQSCSAEH